MFDFLEEDITYYEIQESVEYSRNRAENMDEDTLVDELAGILHHIQGDEYQELERIILKSHSDAGLSNKEIKFLENVFVTFFCTFGLVVDTGEEDE